MRKISFTLFAFLITSTSLSYASEKNEICQIRKQDRDVFLKYPNSAPYSPPTSGIQSPFRWNESIDKIKTGEIIKYTSGFYCDSSSNHPTIYASTNEITVVGPGYQKTFNLKSLDEAFRAYRGLLKSAGYGD